MPGILRASLISLLSLPAVVAQAPVVTTLVLAADAQGRAVAGLRADEIRVFEDDRPQSVTTVRTPANRAFLLVIDDMNIQPADTILARQMLRGIRDILRPEDLIAIVSTGFSSVQQDLLYDPDSRRVNSVIEKLMGSGFSPLPSMATLAPRQQQDIRYSVHVALRTTTDLMSHVRPRATDVAWSMIYISSGYPLDPFAGGRVTGARERYAALALGSTARAREQLTDADLVDQLAIVAATAQYGNVAIYAADPTGAQRGPGIADRMPLDEWRERRRISLTALRYLSDSTGGFCVCEDNNVASALNRIAAEARHHYLVSHTIETRASAPTRRALRIETTRPGVTLRYPSEHFAAR